MRNFDLDDLDNVIEPLASSGDELDMAGVTLLNDTTPLSSTPQVRVPYIRRHSQPAAPIIFGDFFVKRPPG